MSVLQDMDAETGNNLDGLGHPDEWPIVIDWNHRRRELIADRRQIREEMERRLAEDNRRQTIAFCDVHARSPTPDRGDFTTRMTRSMVLQRSHGIGKST